METISTPLQISAANAGAAGLTTGEAQRRLGEVGANEIARGAATSPWKILADLSLSDCVVTLLLGLIPVTVLELTKLVRRARQRGANRSSEAREVPA